MYSRGAFTTVEEEGMVRLELASKEAELRGKYALEMEHGA